MSDNNNNNNTTAEIQRLWSKTQADMKRRLKITLNSDHLQLILPPAPSFPSDTTFGGCDLTEPTTATIPPVSSYCVLNSELEVVHELHENAIITQPYIPSYLSFREAPLLLPLLLSGPEPTYLLTDGNGLLHPREFGFACHLGLLLEESGRGAVVTIGCSKNLHVFEGLRTAKDQERDVDARTIKDVFKEFQEWWMKGGGELIDVYKIGDVVVLDNLNYDEYELPESPPESLAPIPSSVLYLFGPTSSPSSNPIGASYLKKGGESANPIFVSVGNRCSLTTAIHCVDYCSIKRVPEPVRMADKGGRSKIRQHNLHT
ncbi:hypothetical protein TrVE_jg9935 [Triparma verrucosa]|uniref:Endonuclease V n=1 Tax=Triparma verrucosa TaxID=1606542 RepID=A0A9W7EWX5_9STRA|nr:hypothetical protein TrVE_jg9935 [Triparma verrucosa]